MSRRRLPDEVPVSYQTRWSRKNKEKGLCSDCVEAAEPGHKLCKKHLDARRDKWHLNKDKWRPKKTKLEPILPEMEDAG